MKDVQIPNQPAIKVYLTEKEIVSANCDRLVALFSNRDAADLRVLHQSVELVLPRKFSSRFAKLSFEHPEVRTFAVALLAKMPGISFFFRLDCPPVFKQLLFATLPTIRIARQGRKAFVALPEDEFAQAIEREINAAADLAKKAGFTLIPTESFALAVKAYFDSPKYC
jgi:hypothetical protein